jgi:hypothetical protein
LGVLSESQKVARIVAICLDGSKPPYTREVKGYHNRLACAIILTEMLGLCGSEAAKAIGVNVPTISYMRRNHQDFQVLRDPKSRRYVRRLAELKEQCAQYL